MKTRCGGSTALKFLILLVTLAIAPSTARACSAVFQSGNGYAKLTEDPSDCNPLGTRKALILIHGIHSNADVWNSWVSSLRNFNGGSTFQSQYKPYRFEYQSDVESVTGLGQDLSSLVTRAIGSQPSVILAHSMGGLVARSYMDEAGGGSQVSLLITLATPHHGTPAANSYSRDNLASASWAALFDLADIAVWRDGGLKEIETSLFHDRRDLTWDNYDTFFNAQATNTWLSSLNAADPNWPKVIAYYGYPNPSNTYRNNLILQYSVNTSSPGSLATALLAAVQSHDSELLSILDGIAIDYGLKHNFSANDGLVPIESARAAGHTLQKQAFCKDFYHFDFTSQINGVCTAAGGATKSLLAQVATDLGLASGPAATGALLSATPSSIDYGAVSVGTTATRTVSLRNTGDANLTISALSLNGAPEFSVKLLPSLPVTLSPGDSESVTIAFKPSTASTGSTTLLIGNNSSNAAPSLSVSLSGNGSKAVDPAATCGPGSSEGYSTQPVHPVGTFVLTSGDPTVYLIQGPDAHSYAIHKDGIADPSVLANPYNQSVSGDQFSFSNMINITSSEMSSYPTGGVISSARSLPSNNHSYPAGTLIQASGSAEIAIVQPDGSRRPFPTESLFLGLGYLYCNVKSISAADYASYSVGTQVDGVSDPKPPFPAPSLALPTSGATAIDTSVSLSWNSVAGSAAYGVYLSTANPPASTALLMTTTTYKPPSSLQPGTTYYWTISSIDPNTNLESKATVRSFTTAVKTSLAAPALISPVDGSTGIAIGASLTWNVVDGASGYSIHFGTTNPPPVVSTTGSATYAPALNPNTTSYWTVGTLDPNANNTESATAPIRSFSTAGGQAPGSPSITLAAVSPSAIALMPGGVSQLVKVTVNRTSYTGNLTLTVGALPPGVRAGNVDPQTYNDGGIQINATSTAATIASQPISFTISGTGIASVSGTFLLSVGPMPQGPAFSSLTASGPSAQIYRMDVAPDGSVYILAPMGSGLGVAKSSNKGQSFQPAVSIPNSSFTNSQYSLAVDLRGVIHAVWYLSAQNATEAYYSQSRDGGVTFTNPLTVRSGRPYSGYTTTNAVAPVVAADGAGNVYVAFSASTIAGGGAFVGYDVWVARSTDGGGSFQPEFFVTTPASPQRTPVRIRCNLTDFYVLFSDDTNHDLYFYHGSAGAIQTNATTRVNPSAGKNSSGGDLAVDTFGQNVYTVFTDLSTDYEGDITLCRSGDAGATWGNCTRVNDNTYRSQQLPSIGLDNYGFLNVVWDDLRSNSKSQTYYARSTDGGVTFSPNINLSADQPNNNFTQASFALDRNRMWLYVAASKDYQQVSVAQASMNGPTPSALSATLAHSGHFQQGQNGAAFTAVVSNATGGGATSGTVSVIIALPVDLTLVSMSGTGWNCSSSTCTRADSLAAGVSYAPITVTVNVAASAAASLTMQVNVSGGGSAGTSASDTVTVDAGATSAQVNIWWPTPSGTTVSGTQPLKMVLNGATLSSYQGFWQVDGGSLVSMGDSHDPANPSADHKEVSVDFTGWTWRGGTNGLYGPYVLNFVAQTTSGVFIAQQSTTIYVSTAGSTPPTPQVNIWWPSPSGATVSGTQPLKMVLTGAALSSYQGFWQVDGGSLVSMGDSHDPANPSADHKEVSVDFSGWTWRGGTNGLYGPYVLNFVAQTTSGVFIAQQSTTIYVQK